MWPRPNVAGTGNGAVSGEATLAHPGMYGLEREVAHPEGDEDEIRHGGED